MAAINSMTIDEARFEWHYSNAHLESSHVPHISWRIWLSVPSHGLRSRKDSDSDDDGNSEQPDTLMGYIHI
jgi:hypothetical protein